MKEVYVQQDENLADRPMLPMIYEILGDKSQSWKIKKRTELVVSV